MRRLMPPRANMPWYHFLLTLCDGHLLISLTCLKVIPSLSLVDESELQVEMV